MPTYNARMTYHADHFRPGITHSTKSYAVEEGSPDPTRVEVGADHPLMRHFKATYPVRDETLQALRAAMTAE